MLRTDTTIKVATIKAGKVEYIPVPAKKYGYLAIHLNLHIDPDKLLARDFKLSGIYAITHIPTGNKLPFNGSLASLRIFCKQCGDDSNLWDNPDEVSNLIIERAISFGLIQERSIN